MSRSVRARATLPMLSMLVMATSGCGTTEDSAAANAEQDSHSRFLASLSAHCGEAFPGRLVLEPDGDTMLTGTELLLLHFHHCDTEEVRIPFHIEVVETGAWDSSRTWYLMRSGNHLELRHDHRQPDGSEDSRTWYGGLAMGGGTANRQDFASPERTAAAGAPVGWRIEIEPGVHYRYGTTHDGAYDWMIEFDLSESYATKVPDVWGAEDGPSRIPGPP